MYFPATHWLWSKQTVILGNTKSMVCLSQKNSKLGYVHVPEKIAKTQNAGPKWFSFDVVCFVFKLKIFKIQCTTQGLKTEHLFSVSLCLIRDIKTRQIRRKWDTSYTLAV